MNCTVDLMANTQPGYTTVVVAFSSLTQDEIARCFDLLDVGGAVNTATMRRDLPSSQMIAVSRYYDDIVGIGVIKPIRIAYSTGISKKCGYPFPPETPELGYLAVDHAHRGQGLSHEITTLLLKRYKGPLFATTSNARMKKTLANAAFQKQGKEWQGTRDLLSFWERM